MKKTNGMAKAFLLNAFLSVLTFGIFMIKENGLFSLSNDLNAQIVPFTKTCLDSLHEGGGIWNWNIDMGANIVSTMSYYRLGSPFFWLFSWCDGKNVLYILGWEYIAKYTFTGMASYCYLRRYAKSDMGALTGSVLYTFSGFQATNLLFMIFHDAVAFFPLLLLAFEDLAESDRKGLFAFTVFLNAVVNYYCFIGEVVFLVIYFIVRYMLDNPKKYIKRMRVCLIEGILGIMMASVLFAPSILATLKSPRVSDSLQILRFFSVSRRDILVNISSFLLPAEMMMDRSNAYLEDWASRSAYLPMIGIVFECAYMIKIKKNDWLKRLLAILTILMLFPLGNGLFSLFTTNYCRWYYMPILLMVLSSVMVFDRLTQYRVGLVASAVIVLMSLWCMMSFWWHNNKFELIFNKERFLALFAMGIAGVIITLAVRLMPFEIAIKQKICSGGGCAYLQS